MPDRDSSLQLAGRLSSKRQPRTTTALVVSAGLTTATLLILAAGNTRTTADAVARGEPAASQSRQAAPAYGLAHGAAVSVLRGSIDLAANRLNGAELR